MSFLDSLRKSIEDEVVVTHLFLLEYNPRDKIVHAFFEGKTDESFYGTFIRRFKLSGWKLRTYVCGNKDSVYYHHKELSSKQRKYQPLLFFVDKDLDDIIPFSKESHECIFVTSYYSVENYVVTTESLEQIWSEIFRQSSGTNDSDQLIKTFEVAHISMQQILIDVMSWVLAHRREGTRPNLDCILTNELFDLDDTLQLNRTFVINEELYEWLDTRTKVVTTTEIKEQIYVCRAELSEFEPKEVIRGHNEMDFFVEFVKKLKHVVSKVSGNKIKANVEITKSNILDVMGPRVPIPDRLSDFLKSHLQFEGVLLLE